MYDEEPSNVNAPSVSVTLFNVPSRLFGELSSTVELFVYVFHHNCGDTSTSSVTVPTFVFTTALWSLFVTSRMYSPVSSMYISFCVWPKLYVSPFGSVSLAVRVSDSVVVKFSSVSLLYPSKVREGTTSVGCWETVPTTLLLNANTFDPDISRSYVPAPFM